MNWTIGQQRFILKVAVAMALIVGCLYLITLSVEANTTRFGGWGWIHWIVGLLVFAAGVIVAWSIAITLLDRRALRAYRAEPGDQFEDGQVVALSGHIGLEGEALEAPFSGRRCAAYSYRVSGERRDVGEDRGQQLCLLGFALAPCALECDGHRFVLAAIPDVDTDFRSIATGGEWGERALAMVESAAKEQPRVGEPEARGHFENAQLYTTAPQRVECFVSATHWGANTMAISEDSVPVDTPVTVLATYQRRSHGLDGRRIGGMKIFAGDIDERLAVMDRDWRKELVFCVPLLSVGGALLTLATWLP